MISKVTLAAGLVALTTFGAAAPASATTIAAEFGRGGPEITFKRDHHRWGERGRWNRTLSAQEVRWVLRDHGFRDIRFVDRQGRVYQARATDRRGHRVGIVVSARSGEILNVYRM
jgi:hypothetical protein